MENEIKELISFMREQKEKLTHIYEERKSLKEEKDKIDDKDSGFYQDAEQEYNDKVTEYDNLVEETKAMISEKKSIIIERLEKDKKAIDKYRKEYKSEYVELSLMHENIIEKREKLEGAKGHLKWLQATLPDSEENRETISRAEAKVAELEEEFNESIRIVNLIPEGKIAKETYLGLQDKIKSIEKLNMNNLEEVAPELVVEGEKPTGEKPSGEKPTGEKPSGEKPSGEKPSGEKPSGEKPSGEKPSGEKPSGEKPSGEKPSGEKPSGEKPSGEKPSGEKPSGEKPSGEKPTGEKPSGEKPTGEKPSGEKPSGEKPTGEKPSGEKPTGEEQNHEETKPNIKKIIINAETGYVIWDEIKSGTHYSEKIDLDKVFSDKNLRKIIINILDKDKDKKYIKILKSRIKSKKLNPAILSILKEQGEVEDLKSYIDVVFDKEKGVKDLPFEYEADLQGSYLMRNKTLNKLNSVLLRDNKELGTQFPATKHLKLKRFLSKMPLLTKSTKSWIGLLPERNDKLKLGKITEDEKSLLKANKYAEYIAKKYGDKDRKTSKGYKEFVKSQEEYSKTGDANAAFRKKLDPSNPIYDQSKPVDDNSEKKPKEDRPKDKEPEGEDLPF